MALQVAQAYCNIDDSNINISYSDTISSNGIFKNFNTEEEKLKIGGNNTYAIYYFGIQSLPGVIFNINSNKTNASSTIKLGQTGIFELDLFDTSPIGEVQFENLIQKLSENSDTYGVNYCLIDVIYEVIQ